MLQKAVHGTAKADFPSAESGTIESPEAELEVESPQCVKESVSKTPVTEAVPGDAHESSDAGAESAIELSTSTPPAPHQAVIGCRHEAPEVCFRFAALLSQFFAFARMHCKPSDPHRTKRISAFCIWYVG